MMFLVEYPDLEKWRPGAGTPWTTQRFFTLKEACAAAVYRAVREPTVATLIKVEFTDIEAAAGSITPVPHLLGRVSKKRVSAMTSGVPRPVRVLAANMAKEVKFLMKLAA